MIKQKGEVITLLLVFLASFSIGYFSGQIRDSQDPLKCKTDSPDVKCEIYRE